MKRLIKKVAVIGSGIMGSGIACHFANIGVEVLLLDIVPRELTEAEQKKGLTLESKVVRNRIVNEHLANALKSKPSPIYNIKFADRITTGNTTDDLSKIAEADWIIEVVVERLDIKKQVFEQIEKYRKPGTLITSNTSGIPIHFMSEGRSEDFQKHFCGTHFFNPARYLKLFEIIPGPKTSTEVLDFLNNYGEQFLGKTSVIAKDTPAFIGNRIGIFGIMSLFHQVKELGLTIEEVDKLTGPVIGRPKSATFRTVDVVGLDTLVHVANGLYEGVPNDEAHELFKLPEFISKMMENKWLGSKTGQGFYKKVDKDILSLDLDTLEYRAPKKASFATLELTKTIDKPIDRFKVLVKGTDKAGEFYRKNFAGMFAYVANRVPEITEDFYKIDDAMKAGFGWENGPFEIWDAIGVEKGIELMKAEGHEPAAWVTEMLASGNKSFYTIKDGATYFYDRASKSQKKVPGQDAFILLNNIRESKKVWSNSGAVIHDLGDGILNLEFQSKMNTIGGDVLQGINKAIDLAEKEYNGLVIGNQGANFSVGANIGMIFMMAVEQEYDELNMAIKLFQDTMMRVRYSGVPVVVAPHGMTLGGGCEMSMHADKVVAAAETYIGLVEFGVGVIPGGGGSKEMALRASDLFRKNDVELNVLQEYFLTVAMAKVSTSAYEAYDLGILQHGKDVVVVNKDRQIAEAKKHALIMAEAGYTQPVRRKDVKVLGKQALGMFLVGTDSMEAGHYISEHDKKIANKLAYVMAGGDLSEPTLVTEQYLLDIEREAFLSLCTERKTLERIQYMLTKGKPLRN
ncbi:MULTISPECIES: 3-hydroxyacyl-CoA dehydrogenase/enoyl-CoA hydratase family protein [Flavobacterium]|jgi:3-hydroxyacyl-CoA dehydrogenase|uniref:3-hydroxyacyl-CoA dehydrogenase n=1 Tax=Flavobacterium lindanitolerans TaxID=428988 RepID=A0A497UIR5_9FLAO|nr:MULTISPECIES: 3-hydroxyacyl-CoA dehydrogenase/enoyl-CoA hydratase family protein [Flavobacterium]MBU7569461.1 3-hydroxyacyl-CoA dehydrogenase/enoyl-CoA hydratase family protein [Flavobacterium sp.]PZO34148.1 MAG: 3-hydroxyacyl-CoA dehydrogenase [Flavobacteriaceae bacterium]KQS47801.1 3-hydroxyacyl-CoA dehydrogenase [Flavobacterium sp. Leaf359]MDQ7961274.1 3-hydroxyacyl-CoA dehydrogenase NAD-binding domain-containing protein [Flavobacterium lindanitolerans]OJX54061.1 MAG: 3-hydroxyacyl-CoA d